MDHEEARPVEISRQMERFVDHQIRASEELDDKIEVLLSLALTLTGGGVALLRLSAPPEARFFTAAPIALGIVLASSSAILLLHGYIGVTRRSAPRIHPGADPEWLAGIAGDPSWSLAHLHHATIKGFGLRAEENERESARIGTLRRVAIYLALAALLAYAVGTFMTLGGA